MFHKICGSISIFCFMKPSPNLILFVSAVVVVLVRNNLARQWRHKAPTPPKGLQCAALFDTKSASHSLKQRIIASSKQSDTQTDTKMYANRNTESHTHTEINTDKHTRHSVGTFLCNGFVESESCLCL